jgi:hypothetical protein
LAIKATLVKNHFVLSSCFCANDYSHGVFESVKVACYGSYGRAELRSRKKMPPNALEGGAKG